MITTTSEITAGQTSQTFVQSFSVPVNPPSKFDFSNPVAWPQWRKRFERFMAVSGQNLKSDSDKIDILMYTLGEDSEQIMLQFENIPTTYIQALSEFEHHFIPRRNIIFERYKFNTRMQLPGEPIENFITNLHSLAEHCNYQSLKDELIRDRIVVGMLDRRTSERLQLKPGLTLQECVIEAKQSELQANQSRELQISMSQAYHGSAAEASSGVYALRPDSEVSGSRESRRSFDHRTPTNDSASVAPRSDVARLQKFSEIRGRSCSYCGLDLHKREKCPARNSRCRACQKQGHWAVVCRANKVRSIQTIASDNTTNNITDDNTSNSYLGSILVGNIHEHEWVVELEIREINKKFNFLLDTGSDITCVPMKLLHETVLQTLSRSNRIVTGPSGRKLNLIGILHATLYLYDKKCTSEVYVIEHLCKPILGRSAIKKLNILQFGEGIRSQLQAIQINCDQIRQYFPKIFDSIGSFKTEMNIKIDPNIHPFIQSVPRSVPIPLLKPLKEELERLLKLDIIEPVDYHTPWVSPIVIVRKNEKIRLCVDYTKLNKAVLRTHFPIGKVERILAQVSGSQYFSRLDTVSGFYQIRLSTECQHLTCFITPFGRFIFKRLPFGITCAPEYFSMLLHRILDGIDGVVFHIDDILIHAPTLDKHNEILSEVLKRIQSEGITLNREKCIFGVQSLKFLGHLISNSGISVDPDRIQALVNFPEPRDKTELLRFLGMVNFSSRFLKNRSHILEPMTAILKKNTGFNWDLAQKQSFSKIKQLLQESPCLEYFDTFKKTIVSADASSFGIGACLMQQNERGENKVVCYASRLLSKTEQRYAQIERECLALTWACEKFSEYVSGIKILLETDHSPLVQILQTKPIDELTPRLQRFRLRLMRYDYEVYYVPGKEIVVADALSRNFPNSNVPDDDELVLETDVFVNLVIESLEVKPYLLEEIKQEQMNDRICIKLREFTLKGWPANRNRIDSEILPYFQYRFEISDCDGYLIKGTRLIIPKILQTKIINFIHQGHQGIVKCRARAKTSVWWLGLSTEIDNLVRNCPRCVENRVNNKEPFIRDEFPERAWQKVACDLYKLNGIWYLIVTDYFSRFFEIFKLVSLTSSSVITKLKELFCRFGIPEIVRSDNGGQFRYEFDQFGKNYGFQVITSSPRFPQSNGQIEAAVKTAKSLIKKSQDEDVYLALLSYRTTPLENGFTPAELLFNHKIRSHLPILPKLLKETVDSSSVFKREDKYREKMARNYNKRHRVKELPELQVGDSVWVTDLKLYGKIVQKLNEPRSYLIDTNSGFFRRNRWHLILAKYHIFVRNNLDYRSADEVTPMLPRNRDINPNSNVVGNQSQNVDQSREDEIQNCRGNRESVCGGSGEISVDEGQEIVCSRSTRERKKPTWLNDYVTD